MLIHYRHTELKDSWHVIVNGLTTAHIVKDQYRVKYIWDRSIQQPIVDMFDYIREHGHIPNEIPVQVIGPQPKKPENIRILYHYHQDNDN